MTLDEFFEGRIEARAIFDPLRAAIESVGPSEMRLSKSQIAFRRRTGFAYAWTPNRYLRGTPAPLVLSVALRHRDPSTRWKEVVEPAQGRFMHHLELWAPQEVDEQVLGWLTGAWQEAE